jgi:3D (Asp-Asp-Asp) domain-containing protein
MPTRYTIGMGRATTALLIGSLLLAGAGSSFSTGDRRPKGLLAGYDAIPLGTVRVTKYTHIETRSRLTSSGYVLKDSDKGKVCAISRDWWRRLIKPGDLVLVEGHGPCVALDTMAKFNRKGLRQLHWIDIYITDRQEGLDFGIQHAQAYLLKAKD